jgi:hypothetical protein
MMEVLAEGTIQFRDIGKLAWLVIVILYVSSMQLFKVMRTVKEKENRQIF